LCQRDSSEKLQCPDKSLRHDKDAGYESLANILPDFEKLGQLPSHLALHRIDEGDGLFAALKKMVLCFISHVATNSVREN